MSIKIGNNIVAKSSTYHPDLFDVKWSDHILDNISWLRADTFSWHSGELYNKAYEHLLDDWNNSELSEEAIPGIASFKVRVAPDGHKMVSTTHDGPERVQEVFEATGIAWYYIIDLVNHRFKLPRTKYAFTGVRDNVGKFVEAGLPNVEGTLQWSNATGIYRPNGSSTGAFYKGTTRTSGMAGTDLAGCADLCFDASKSNEIYGNSDTVQPQATEMYLYFYVGNFAQNDLQNVAGGIQDRDTAVNYDNITNCITKIPQDIKLELNEGILTLKKGSKVYVPNGHNSDGSRNYDTLVIENDIVSDGRWDGADQFLIYVKNDGTKIGFTTLAKSSTGTTAPSETGTRYWLDTTNNLIKHYSNGSDTGDRYSLPIAICSKTATGDSSLFSSVDQVFNGIGYMGSVVFTLTGLSYLIPDGRNEDGSLRNILVTLEKPQIRIPYESSTTRQLILALDKNGYAAHYAQNGVRYDKQLNYNITTDSNKAILPNALLGYYHLTNGLVGNFRPNYCFKALDYNEGRVVIESFYPRSGINSTWYRLYNDGWVEQGGYATSGTYSSLGTTTLVIPMKDTNYCLTLGMQGQGNNTTSVAWRGKTTTNFTTEGGFNGGSPAARNFNWQVSGIAAGY